jgi:hypothetical protein
LEKFHLIISTFEHTCWDNVDIATMLLKCGIFH